MYNNELVSVIIPCLNSARFIADTLASVVNQTYKSIEIILIDNNSCDETRDIIEQFRQRDARILPIYLSEALGAAGARNVGINKSSGRYVAFVDSDDIWVPDKLQIQMDAAARYSVPIVFTGYSVMDENGAYICEFKKMPDRVTYHYLLGNTCIATSSVLLDRVFTGDFRFSEVRMCEDFLLWLSILKCGNYAVGISGDYMHYRVVGSSLSSNKKKSARTVWGIIKNQDGLSIFEAVFYFIAYAYRGFLKNRKMGRV